MNILVLGSEGQIGKPFCAYAKSKGHRVIYYDKVRSNVENLANYNVSPLVEKVFFADIVVFLAFEVGGSKFLNEKDKTIEYISENIRLMDNTFSVLKDWNKPFLFASSQMSNMYHTNYGLLKAIGERYTRAIGDKGYICRFWNVYGYETPGDPKAHVITDFIQMAKEGCIKMMTSGIEQRQFLYTDDCSKALLHWCENYNLYNSSEYIDITSFEWTSILDVAKIIQKHIPCDIQPGIKTDTIQQGTLNVPSTSILKFWTPEISLEDGIKKLI